MNEQPLSGKLIVFEGPDGVGKTTVSRAAATWLAGQGIESEYVSLPEGGTKLGKLVYRMHHEADDNEGVHLAPFARQLLHLAAQVEAIQQSISPALAAGKYVLLDRFWWSTCVYSQVDGLTLEQVGALESLAMVAWQGIKPSAVILLESEGSYDPTIDPLRWSLLKKAYRTFMATHIDSGSVSVVPNTQRIADVVGQVQEIIAGLDGDIALQSSLPLLDYDMALTSSHIAPIKPTPLYDLYWRFAAERQNIFARRLVGEPPPWTDDPILLAYKFTNAYRASDRVSQYLIHDVVYRDDLPQSNEDLFFRIVLFKLFNKPSTWEALEDALGPLVWRTYDFEKYDEVLSSLMRAGYAIYSSAYIMPSGNRHWGYQRKHQNHLALLAQMMRDQVPDRLAMITRMQDGFEILESYPTLGPFLAYQLITDVNYSEMVDYSEMEFVVPGPGAISGLRKCFVDSGGLNDAELIRFVCDRQEREFERLNLDFIDLWGRPLQLIDCQNLFCEIDKYARVALPELSAPGGRTRIKHRFRASAQPLAVWYPPKWGINQRIADSTPAALRRQ